MRHIAIARLEHQKKLTKSPVSVGFVLKCAAERCSGSGTILILGLQSATHNARAIPACATTLGNIICMFGIPVWCLNMPFWHTHWLAFVATRGHSAVWLSSLVYQDPTLAVAVAADIVLQLFFNFEESCCRSVFKIPEKNGMAFRGRLAVFWRHLRGPMVPTGPVPHALVLAWGVATP